MEIHTSSEVIRCRGAEFDERKAVESLREHAKTARRFTVSAQISSPEACLQLLGYLERMDKLTYLSLADQRLSSACVAVVGDALRATPVAAPIPVSTLALESCGLSDEDGAMLLEKIRNNPYIEQLFLSGNELALESCKALAACLEMHASNVFKVVQLGYNVITAECIEVLQESIGRHRMLNALSLHGNQLLSDRGCALLCDSLRTDTLQILNLAGTNLRGMDVSPLCRLIEESVVLAELILAQNYLPDEAIPVLSTALEESASLRSLDLSYNCFGKGESSAIGDCLIKNKTMIHLSVAGNLLSTRTVEALAAGLEQNHTLTSLDVSQCCLNDEALQALEKGILQNDTLRELYCDGNNWHTEGSQRIMDALSDGGRNMKSELEMLFTMVDWNKTRAREMRANQLAAGLADTIPPPPAESPQSAQPQGSQRRKKLARAGNSSMRRLSFVESIKRQVHNNETPPP